MSGTQGTTEGGAEGAAAPVIDGTWTAVVDQAAAGAGAEGTAGNALDGQGAEGTATAAAPTPAVPQAGDWRDRRIRQLTAQLHEARAKAGGAAPIAGENEAGTGAAAAQAGYTQEEFQRQVEAAAARQAELNEFNRVCNEVAAQGRSAFGEAEFNGRVAELSKIVNGADQGEVAKYNDFLLATIETGQGPKLLHALGGDLNNAARIMSLSPVKMAVELAKLALADAGGGGSAPAGNAITSAPRPITPVGARNAEAANIAASDANRADALSTRDWMAKREAEVAARFAARQ